MTVEEWGDRSAAGGRSVPPTPHLASPLEGGRDELGKEWVVGGVVRLRGSCLRRNDGGGGAGMTEEGAQE